MPHQIGDTVRLSTTFEVGGVLTDPTDVTLVIREPDGTSTTEDYSPGDIVRDSVGAFHLDVVVDAAGLWSWKWTGTGAAVGVDEGTFTVEATLLGGAALCSVDDVKTALELTTTDNDDLIQSLVVAASTAIPERYQREFIGPTGGTRTFSVGRYGYLVDLAPYDLRSGGTLTLHPEESAQALTLDSDYMLYPDGGARLGGTYMQVRLSGRLVLNSTLYREFGSARLRIAGNWGCFSDTSSLPESIKRAAVLTVASWMDRAVAEFAMAPIGGAELRPDRFGTYSIPLAAHSVLSLWGRIGDALMASSTIPAFKSALVTRIDAIAALDGVDVTYGYPAPRAPLRDLVWVGNARGAQTTAAMGQRRREERWVQEITVSILRQVREAQEDVTERAFEVVGEIEDSLRAWSEVTGNYFSQVVREALVVETDLEELISLDGAGVPQEREARITMRVACANRI